MTWQENLAEQMRSTRLRQRVSTTTPFGPHKRPMQIDCTLEFWNYIVAAAEKAGVRRSTFVRRAAAVQAAYILGIDVRMILFEAPSAKKWDNHYVPGEQAAGLRDLGEGIEAWCPHPGCSGDHLVPNSGQGVGLP